MHEWIADKTNHIASAAEADVLFQEFHRFRGEYSVRDVEKEWKWETVSSVRAPAQCSFCIFFPRAGEPIFIKNRRREANAQDEI